MKMVLPERLNPVTASQTVLAPASSPKLLASRSDASAKMGGSQLRFSMGNFASGAMAPEMGAGCALRKVDGNNCERVNS